MFFKWLAQLELGTPVDHSAWAIVKSLVAFPDPPYSPIFLSGFDEEEYANRPLEEDEEVADVEVKVVGAEAEKEPKAGKKATQAECDPHDNAHKM